MMEEKVSRDEAARQVKLLARRMAMLFQVFSEVLIEELGEEEGLRLVDQSIKRYGTRCGSLVRKEVEAQGLKPTLINYYKIPDLPQLGWEGEKRILKDQELEADVFYCPMAELWLEEGQEKIGRRYCRVDEAKFAGFDPGYECHHTRNLLDGDKKCTMVVKKKGK